MVVQIQVLTTLMPMQLKTMGLVLLMVVQIQVLTTLMPTQLKTMGLVLQLLKLEKFLKADIYLKSMMMEQDM